MQTLKYILIISLIMIGVQKIQAQDHTLRIKKSELSWTGKAAFNSYSLTGTITPKEGIATITNNILSSLQLVINMKSIDHENNDLKSHLKNEDFFEVKKFPTAIFNVKNPVSFKDATTILKGNLTIKGKTNTENIPVNIETTASGILITFKYSIDRTKYGVNHNSPSIFKRMKENAIADEFILEGKLLFEAK
ncbi:YceI family protein [Aquimarina litoralis]|uniref:YceI family protein n=1 Tax=Aquimarina litoralis TaxID=584605 RepID=UPI001C56D781|nr:YceI family protein [Aquimarina litoralis]MBW1295433.1 YceI family protein [Aquimarina litoralis]